MSDFWEVGRYYPLHELVIARPGPVADIRDEFVFNGVVADIRHASREVVFVFYWSCIVASFEELSSGYFVFVLCFEIHSIRLLYFSHKSLSVFFSFGRHHKVKMIGENTKCMEQNTGVLSSVQFNSFQKPSIVSLGKEYMLFLKATIVHMVWKASYKRKFL